MITTKLICDTNVFYTLGSGCVKKHEICGRGERLYYTPMSVLELAGKLSTQSFEQRRAAARAILDVKAIQLPDPDFYKTGLYGYRMKGGPLDLSDAVKAMASSRDISNLRSGVFDHAAQVVRGVNLGNAKHWRGVFGNQWEDDMLRRMRNDIPGFARWHDRDPNCRRAAPKLRRKDKDFLRKAVETSEWLDWMLVACQPMAAYEGSPPQRPCEPTPEQMKHCSKARERIRCYARVYGEYLVRLQTDRALPCANDSIDLEFFIYCIDDHHIFVTSEKKLVALAQRAGFSQRVRQVKMAASAIP